MTTRRELLIKGGALGTMLSMPKIMSAMDATDGVYVLHDGAIKLHPVSHASFVLETPAGVIYVDPVGDPALYSDFATPDLVLITHEHGDHFNAETLDAIIGDKTAIVTNPAVFAIMPKVKMMNVMPIANWETYKMGDLTVQAVPAYNTTEDRLNFHPQGRDNGYVLDFGDYRFYASGDTEDIPEMRALTNIDFALLCMNLPFTMDATAAASAVADFKPKVVMPYHYRGRDGGTQDPKAFAEMVADAALVDIHDWYNGELGDAHG